MIFQTSKYDYNIGIRRFAELTAKEIEELRQKNIKEFDVNSRIPDSRRDKERFVVGSDGSIYYTDSHYGDAISPTGLPNFIKIK